MSRPRLPPELLENVVDFLHDSRNTLKSCCLVSKSWIPRTRKYLFADIKFRFLEDLQLWELAFPDPSISPACYAKTLAIGSPQVIAAAAGGGGWVLAFSRVVHLTINTLETDSEPIAISLIPFHGFSPVLKSLRVVSATLTLAQTFDLIRSFPLLEDLSTYIDVDDPAENYGFDKQPAIIQPSPAFTGSLELFSPIGTDPFVPRLLALPNGLRFRNLDLTWYRDGDPSSTSALVEECCSTLERLKIDAKVGTMVFPHSAHVNLANAMKLEDLTFICLLRPSWILRTLRTVTQNHRKLEWVTLSMLASRGLRGDVKEAVGGIAYPEWLELDCLLAQLHESHSIRLKVLYNVPFDTDGSRERRRMEVLLPEVMTRGIVDLVGWKG